MNETDITQIQNLSKRYGPTNLTGFKIVGKNTSIRTFLKHLECDIKILNSCDLDYKKVYRVILRKNSIDICSNDNGTPVSYYFTHDASFTPDSLSLAVKAISKKHGVNFKEMI